MEFGNVLDTVPLLQLIRPEDPKIIDYTLPYPKLTYSSSLVYKQLTVKL